MTEQDMDQLVDVKLKADALSQAIDGLCHAKSAVESDLYPTYHQTIQEECLVRKELAEAQCRLLLKELQALLAETAVSPNF